MISQTKLILIGILSWTTLPIGAAAQPLRIPFERVPFFVDSGLHDGHTGPTAESHLAYHTVVRAPGAPWLRLLFQAHHLGAISDSLGAVEHSSKADSASLRYVSYISITSLEDDGRQRLDAVSMKHWRNTSAYFNGEAVEVELHVAPGDKGIFFSISELMAGEQPDTNGSLQKTSDVETLCGDDDRSSEDDAAVGRLLGIDAQGDTLTGCTGWIASNGAYLTAGHCRTYGKLDILEFDVPASETNGWPNFAHPDDQYPVDQESVDSQSDGTGKDWAIFDCNPNSNTGLLPTQAQGAFYRLSLDHDAPDKIRVTGYGIDKTPKGPGGGPSYCGKCNSDSETQQTATGSYEGKEQGYGYYLYKYKVDTEDHNCGSPLIIDGTTLTIGVHTYGGCEKLPYNANAGTAFRHSNFRDAIIDFWGTDVVYVDKDHPSTNENGTPFQPHHSIEGGLGDVVSGGVISAVTGYYNETLTINQAVTITAPVGMVTIGTSGMGKALGAASGVAISSTSDTSGNPVLPTEYSLSSNYPNPFNAQTVIKYALKEDSRVSLTIYNILGQVVRKVVDDQQATAYYTAIWDGNDSTGRLVPTGIYIYRLVATSLESGEHFVDSNKMVLMK